MISMLRGTLSAVYDGKIEIDTGMMGFEVFVPVTVLDTLPRVGEEVKLYTHLSVKEDDLSLFGFGTRDALQMFRLLITVSGIGPKGALAILSAMSPSDIRFAILSGDAKKLSQAQGVGAKTAQRLCMELKDKVSLEEGLEHMNDAPGGGASSSDSSEKTDAILALTALGYGNSEALSAVSKVDTAGKTTDAIIKEALKYLY